MSISSEMRVVIAGGGTGGHLFPGIAVATELRRRFEKCGILFVVGRRGRGAEILRRAGYEPAFLDIEGLKGRGAKRGLKVLGLLPKSFLQARKILRSYMPKVILGVGGYSAGPVCVAGRTMGIPTAIHEQNAYPGLTNRWLSRIVDCVFISFEQTGEALKGPEPILTGTPVREGFFQVYGVRPNKDGKFTILVTGGSQGARAINNAVVEALCILKQKGMFVQVIHQTGELDYQETVSRYKDNGLDGKVVDFIKDMAGAYREADLVICRSGASTIFELAAAGRPAILIPYPYATNRHQELNAMAMAELGGAEVLLQSDLSSESLASLINKYMNDRQALEQMAQQARKLSRPDAAKLIVDGLVKLVN